MGWGSNHSGAVSGQWAAAPSVFTGADGRPLFSMPVQRAELRDAGLANLFFREIRCGGFEYSCRAFLREHLAAGDAFIDAGAHRGVYSLTAWFACPGEVEVLAVEPHPDNAKGFELWARHNKVDRGARLVRAALADVPGEAWLRQDSTMGHRLADPEDAPQGAGPPLRVPATTLDRLLQEQPLRNTGRVYLKIDVEGAEPEALRGGLELLRSGRVAAVIWEKGRAYEHGPGRERFLKTLQMLRDLGFDHFRFPHEDTGGPLVPYVHSPGECNVVSLERGFGRREVYPKPFGPFSPQGQRSLPAFTREQAEDFTRRLMRARSTDAARWVRDEHLVRGARLRAGVAASFIGPESSVLDLGCGLMNLGLFLQGNPYTPLDIVARSRDCLVRDLNQYGLPEGRWEWVAALHLLEFIHDPEALLRQAAARCRELALSYHPVETVPVSERRAAGFFNDMSRRDLLDVVSRAGFAVRLEDRVLAETLLVCQTKDRT